MDKKTLTKYLSIFPITPMEDDFRDLIYDNDKLRKMKLKLLLGDNFALAGNAGTGKTSLLNYLQKYIEQKKLGLVIRVNEVMLNEDVFYRKLLSKIFLKVKISSVHDKKYDDVKQSFFATESLKEFLKDLVYYEPRKKIDNSRLISLYKDFLKKELEHSKNIDLMFNNYTVKNVIAEILRKTPRRIYILVDDYDKFMLDPYGKEGAQNRLGLFLTSIKELMEFSKSSWIFSIPQEYYEHYYIRVPYRENLNFMSVFSDAYVCTNFNYTEYRQYLTKKLNKIKITPHQFLNENAFKLIFILSKGNPQMINYIIKNALLSDKLRRGKKINEDDVLSHLLNYGKYDKRDLIIIKYIANMEQTFSNDKKLLAELTIENVALMYRLKKLKEKSILKSKFLEGIKYFLLNYEEDQ